MNRFKKWLIPVALVCLLLATLVGCSEAPASLGEIYDPTGNPFAHRFSDVKDIRTATFVVAASDSKHKYEADYRCDGANDQVQINAALAAVDGAHVFLLEGTFYTEAAIVMGDDDSLVGSGPGTVITFPNTLAASISVIEDSNPGGASHDIVLENFTLDGNSAGVAGGNQTGITIDTCGSGEGAAAVPGIIIRNLMIKDFVFEAMWLDTIYHSIITECKIINTDGVWIGTGSAYCQITENEIFKSEFYHLYIESGGHFLIADNILQGADADSITLDTVSDSIITGNIIKESGGGVGAIYLSNTHYCVVADNKVIDGAYIGIDTYYATHCTIVGNHVENNGDAGIYIYDSSDNNIIANNYIMGNSQDTDNTDDGIIIDASDRNNIHGNTIRRGVGTNKQRYGINISNDTCDNNRIFDNDLYDSGSSGTINDAGTDTMLSEYRAATFIVAAADSKHKFEADYRCDGTADDVQINAALNALPAGGGKVVLLDGTFTIVDPITFPKNKVTLEGQGRSTFIDGDGLATTEHGIVISGRTDSVVRNLAIQTEDGGGKVSDGIFIEDGSDNFLIEGVTVVNSDRNGIQIEGTNILDGLIQGCRIEDVDYSGITVTMDGGNYMYRLRVESSYLAGGAAGAYGLELEDVENAVISNNVIKDWEGGNIVLSLCNYAVIEGNQIIDSLYGAGIYTIDSDRLLIVDNQITGNGINGIYLVTSDYAVTENNFVQGNEQYGIYYEISHHGQIQGNEVLENSQEFDDSYDGIMLYASDYNLILGNIIRQGSLANHHQYGINIYDDGCDRNCLIGNDLYDSGSTGDLNDVPTTNPTLKHDNRNLAGTGWLPEV